MTIGIPVYNQQDYLADAIESALDQDVQGEIVICNDGSTDQSLAIAEGYAQKHPLIKIINQVNKGLAAARNTIVMNAHYDWILFLDADDILFNKALTTIFKAIHNNPEVDVIAPSFKTFGTSNEVVTLMPHPTLVDFQAGNRLGYCAAIKKAVLQEVGGYNPKMREGYEDLALWCDLLNRGKQILTLPEPLWLYRTKTESMYTKITPEIHKKLIAQINHDVPSAQLAF